MKTDESAVYTRFDAPWEVERILQSNLKLVGSRGVRIVTPVAAAMRVPVLGKALNRAERLLCLAARAPHDPIVAPFAQLEILYGEDASGGAS